ncbi:MAG: MlaE family lipid ABC transporter permease subunit [Brachymonas sp.]|nr:MlaE family lipid ABC transporter permease subunit [Brachymonas sp.]
MERYLHTKYVGQKRFSLEGGESAIVAMDYLIQNASAQGVEEVVIGMAHRGRLNVLVNILGKSPRDLFSEFEGKYTVKLPSGDWTLAHYQALQAQVQQLQADANAIAGVDISELGALDTAGADLLYKLLGAERLRALGDGAATHLSQERQALLLAVADALEKPSKPATPQRKFSTATLVLEHMGSALQRFWQHAVSLTAFIGLTLERGFYALLQPSRWRITALAANLEDVGFNAVPIVALLTSMVGAVVAFLGARILVDFGASVYTVNLVAFSFLREFGVLLAAILVAGRTASAFAAQIGSMRANEEIDAMRVMGLDPVELLVLPRVGALLLALPILTFIGMMSGILGGMLVCMWSLDISPMLFVSTVKNDIGLRHFLLGMGKAPIFAFLIAVIGCLEGFQVEGSAQSVGEHTTSAVVQSIFVVILVDALAALFFMEMGW